MSPAYGYDDEGEREHDCCDVCGSGSCPGSGSGGDDACTYATSRRVTTSDNPRLTLPTSKNGPSTSMPQEAP